MNVAHEGGPMPGDHIPRPENHPIPVEYSTLEPVGCQENTGKEAYHPNANGVPYEVSASEGHSDDGKIGALDAQRRETSWGRKHRLRMFVGAAFFAIVIVVAVVVGVVVGGRKTKDSSPLSPDPSVNSTTPSRSVCRDSICPQILSAFSYGTEASVYVFGRGQDKTVMYRKGDGEAWSNNWTSLGGPFESQPAAMRWSNNGMDMLTIYAVSEGRNVYNMHFDGNVWGAWNNLGEAAQSAPAVCGINRTDVWIASAAVSGGVMHQTTHDAVNWVHHDATWDAEPLGAPSRSNVGVSCRASTEAMHNLVVYSKEKGSAKHNNYNTTKWNGWEDRGGSYIGNPTLVGVAVDSFRFFGIGEDKAMHHWQWTIGQGYGPTDNLGGQFESDAVAIASDVSGDVRVDVVAVGTDDFIKHRAMIGGSWVMEWEDLGVFAHSAPTLFAIAGSESRVGLLVLGHRNEVNYTAWSVSKDPSWKGLSWSSMGGNLTSNYFQA